MAITGANNVTMDNLTYIGNSSTFPEFLIKLNETAYGGWLIFLLLCTAGVIMFMAMNRAKDQPLQNAMYATAILTVVSLFFRVVYIMRDGIAIGLIQDFQLWIFPIISILVATYIKHSQED